jgi:lipopolysaccharide export system protein LptA
MKKLLFCALLSLASLNAVAERADQLKETVIQSDTADTDLVTRISTLTGNVVVTKGTLVLKSDKAVLKETPEGYHQLTLTSEGKPATFRQKRDGGPDLWVEGEAMRVEYDERANLIKLFDNAKIRQLEGKTPTDQFAGEFISYDSRKEQLVSRNDPSGAVKPGGGRVTTIIAPRKKTPPPAGAQ